MNEKMLKILEYDKIIKLLEGQASSEMTRSFISELKPFCDIDEITSGLHETAEAVQIITYKGVLPLASFYDIKDYLLYAKKGGILNIKQLLDILYNMKIVDDVKSFMKNDELDVPMTNALVEVLESFARLKNDLDIAIESEDRLSDNASSELRSIRRKIVNQNETIKNRLNHIVNKQTNQSMLQEAIVTVRDGRYVIPVKQEHRAAFPGIVHDQSSSGATIFVEPQLIVNLNNELRELEIEEKLEVEKILADFSTRVGEVAVSLQNNQNILLRLDFFMAKGKLAGLMQAEMPTMVQDKNLELKYARHPLILTKKAVPLDIIVGKDYDALIVTGPNTGGKTVTLKTAGLLAMMAQTGLHIPASSESKIPLYKKIYADIGDEQSIEQSLSTFSSHMKNIVNIVSEADEGTLVLLDELGAGTDPTEGAALAIAILERLRTNGSTIIATTHYTELKKYAIKTDRVQNASMQFDVETLSPTYKLIIGIPGKSNAFEIAQKLGLDKDIINNSKGLLTEGDIAFEEVIANIEKDKKLAAAEKDEAIMLNIAIKEKEKSIEIAEAKLKEKQEKILAKAREDARKIINQAKDATKEAQNSLKQLQKAKNLGDKHRHLDEARKTLRKSEKTYIAETKPKENLNPVDINDVKVGDRVKVVSLEQNGEVIGLPDKKGEIMVSVGLMKLKCKAKDLQFIIDGVKRKKASKPARNTFVSKTMHISPTIDIRGQTLDEALINVSKYIDDVRLANLEKVTIIHGRGTMVLKNGVEDYLKKSKDIKEYRHGNYNEGGIGVTIVTMR